MAWLDTPPAAGRAWVPGCRARTFHQSVAPFYDESRSQGSPGRDQFVISISGRVYIPLAGASTGCAGPAAGAAAALQKIFVSAEHYDETSVHDQGIYVVIRMHGFLVAIRWLCGAAKADKLPTERSRPTPPGPDRARPPLSPPAGAASFLMVGGFQPPFPMAAVLSREDDPPEPPDVGASPHTPGCRVVYAPLGPLRGRACFSLTRLRPAFRTSWPFTWAFRLLVRFRQEYVQKGYCAVL